MLGLILALWFAAALVAGATGALERAPAPPSEFALLLAILALGAVWLFPAVKRRVHALGMGSLVAFHVARLGTGAYLVLLVSRGTLPHDLGLVAGWGDVAAGLGALLVLMFCLPAHTSAQRTGLLVWNTVGMIVVLTNLGNGLRVFGQHPELAGPFHVLPLTILPLFVEPIVISTHLWIFAWTARPTEVMPSDPIVRPPEEHEQGD